MTGPEFDSALCDLSQCDFSGFQLSGGEEPTRDLPQADAAAITSRHCGSQ
jgi:hypothetical protein